MGIFIKALDNSTEDKCHQLSTFQNVVNLAQWALAAFGPNRVSTYLLVGLGEDPDELVAGAERLIERGIYPFVVPYRPLEGSLAHADGIGAPPADTEPCGPGNPDWAEAMKSP